MLHAIFNIEAKTFYILLTFYIYFLSRKGNINTKFSQDLVIYIINFIYTLHNISLLLWHSQLLTNTNNITKRKMFQPFSYNDIQNITSFKNHFINSCEDTKKYKLTSFSRDTIHKLNI